MFGHSEDRARQLAARARRKRVISSASQNPPDTILMQHGASEPGSGLGDNDRPHTSYNSFQKFQPERALSRKKGGYKHLASASLGSALDAENWTLPYSPPTTLPIGQQNSSMLGWSLPPPTVLNPVFEFPTKPVQAGVPITQPLNIADVFGKNVTSNMEKVALQDTAQPLPTLRDSFNMGERGYGASVEHHLRAASSSHILRGPGPLDGSPREGVSNLSNAASMGTTGGQSNPQSVAGLQRVQQVEILKLQDHLFENISRLEEGAEHGSNSVDIPEIRAQQFAIFEQIFIWEQTAMKLCSSIGPQFRKIVSRFREYLQQLHVDANKAGVPPDSAVHGLLSNGTQRLEQFQQEVLQYLSRSTPQSARVVSNPTWPTNLYNSLFSFLFYWTTFFAGTAPAASSPSVSKTSLNKVFERYRDDPSTPDQIGTSGMMGYLNDLDVDIEDIGMLAVSEIVKSPAMGEMTREGFLAGWTAVGCDTIDKQKAYVKDLVKTLPSSTANFTKLYKHTFQLGKIGNQKAIQLEMATTYWELLFTSPHSPIKWSTSSTPWLEWWNEFLTTQWKRSINKDVWNETLRFAQETLKDENLTFWSEEASWPSVIDEFVEWTKKKREGVTDAMEE